MDIYLTNKDSGDRLRLPLLPDRVSVKTASLPISFQIIKLGDAQLPRGNALNGYSWNGVFPGESMSESSFIFDWQEPVKIVDLLSEWEKNGDILNLMITETGINADTFIENFDYEYYGIDNVSYTLSLTQYRELYISTSPEPTASDTNTTQETQKGYVTGSRVYYRSGPGIENTAYGLLDRGTSVTIYGQSGNWYKINLDPEQWMCATYVKIGDGEAAATTAKKSTSSTKSTASKSATTKKSTGSTSTNSAKTNTSTTTSTKSFTLTLASSTMIDTSKYTVKQSTTATTGGKTGAYRY